MALAITDDHRALADVVRRFAQARDLRGATRASLDEKAGQVAVPASWAALAEQGWAGLHLPEEYGGSGAGLPELAVVVEELGAVAAPGPFVATVSASAVIAARGDADLCGRLLPGLADGSTLGALHLGEGLSTDAAGALTGTTGPIAGAAWADVFLLRAGADLIVVPADRLTVTPTPGLDPALGMAHVDATGVEGDQLAGAAATGLRIVRALAAAEASGIAHATLRMATDYAKVRQQFGRIIGSFQAIKHHLAVMLVDAERATATAWDAARAAGLDDGQGDLAAAVAAAVAVDAGRRNAQMNIQVHGGIGFTWEHDAHLYLRRAVTLAALAGSVETARDDVEAAVRAGVRRQYAVDLPPEAEAFRDAARTFVETFKAAPEPDRRALLVESGYLVPHWQKPWGRGAGAVEQLVIEEELAGIDVPALGIGGWVLLTITQHASPEQIERWIAPSLAGELLWCQLFSEPGAGSDAAAVQTKAVRVEGGWLITGQKVWTSGAHLCNRGLATVRTDPTAAKHRGITTVAVDLHADGVEVRPLREITGDALFNEVFFDDVFVPDSDVVGEVNDGWTVARATLGNERVSIGGQSRENSQAADLLPLAARYAPGDGGLRREIGVVLAAEQTLRLMNLRQVARAVANAEPGAEGSATKLLVAEHAQNVTELGMRLVGGAGIDDTEHLAATYYLLARALTIAGGTSEISKNVIAERLLGLPRDPLNT